MDKTILPERIRAARHTKGLTQIELARRLGVKVSAIHAWEHGRRTPRRANLYALERELGVILRDWDEHEKRIAIGKSLFQLFDIIDRLHACLPDDSPIEQHLKAAAKLLEAEAFKKEVPDEVARSL